MPQLDKFTYFTQFFWLCLILFTFYIAICNDGVLGISRILKLRNRLLSGEHRGNVSTRFGPTGDPYECALESEAISKKGFRTGLSYMYSSLFEVSQWCKQVEKSDFLGKRLCNKSTLISSFGEISGSRGIERKILYLLISKSSYQTTSSSDRKTVLSSRKRSIFYTAKEEHHSQYPADLRRSEIDRAPLTHYDSSMPKAKATICTAEHHSRRWT